MWDIGNCKVSPSNPFIFFVAEDFSQNICLPGKGRKFIVGDMLSPYFQQLKDRVACWVPAQESETPRFPAAVVPGGNLGFHCWRPGKREGGDVCGGRGGGWRGGNVERTKASPSKSGQQRQNPKPTFAQETHALHPFVDQLSGPLPPFLNHTFPSLVNSYLL